MPDARFQQFYRDTATLSWPAADAIARRGRQRRTRQRFAAGLGAAAVAVGIVVAGAAVRGGGAGPAPDPPASPPVSASPSATGGGTAQPSPSPSGPSGTSRSSTAAPLTRVPLAAMLRAADAGPGTWTVSEEANGDWTVYFVLSLCDAPWPTPYVDGIHQRERTISRGESAVVQRVTAFAPGRAADHLDALRAKVGACGTFMPRFGGSQITVGIVQDGFAAADESLVVEVRSSGGVGWHVFVRRGVLVTEVVVAPDNLAESLRVGRAAADRLAQAGG